MPTVLYPVRRISGRRGADRRRFVAASVRSAARRGHLEVHYLGAEENPAARIAAGSRAGDVIATLGAGDIYKTGGEILNALSPEVKVHEGA